MMRSSILAMTLLLLGAATGCSGNEGSCLTDNDCFAGEVCLSSGFCGKATDDNASNSGGDAGDKTPNSTANSTSQDAGNSGSTDSGSPGADAANNGGDDAGAAGACVVDPFIQCVDDEDDRNNDFPGLTVENETKGCQSFGFVPMDVTINGRMCALDPEDMYAITFVECDDDEPGFVVEATLDVKDDCDPDLIHFDVESIGQSCAEPDPEDDQTLRCETLPDGRRRIQVLFPGTVNAVVGSMRFSIQTPDRQDVKFDYDLHLVVREP